MYEINDSLISPLLDKRSKKALEERVRNTRTSDDVIAGVLSFLTTETIPLNTNKIHTAVFKLKEKEPKLFEDFIFTSGDCYPYSELLERTIFRLQNADLISTVNPDFKQFIITKESKNHIKKSILPLFDKEEIMKLKALSQVFQEIITSGK